LKDCCINLKGDAQTARRKEKRMEKEKVDNALLEVCSPYVLCEEKEKAEMNRMTQHDNDFHHRNQLHTLFEDGRVTDACKAHITTFLIFFIYENTTLPLGSKIKKIIKKNY